MKKNFWLTFPGQLVGAVIIIACMFLVAWCGQILNF